MMAEIQRGDNTQTQDQSMWPVSLRPTNKTVRRLVRDSFITEKSVGDCIGQVNLVQFEDQLSNTIKQEKEECEAKDCSKEEEGDVGRIFHNRVYYRSWRWTGQLSCCQSESVPEHQSQLHESNYTLLLLEVLVDQRSSLL